jgi:hypothetical protein
MARRAHPLTLTATTTTWCLATALACAAAACTRDAPMPIALEDTWTEMERAHILRAMERWESATNHLIRFTPSPVPFHDESGEFERADLDDGVSVVYKLRAPSADTDALMDATGQSLLGYNFDTDILIFRYQFYFSLWSDDLELLDAVVLHELGHHFGLGHIRLRPAVMNDLLTGSIPCITRWDLEAFCSLYGCAERDMHPECPDGP